MFQAVVFKEHFRTRIISASDLGQSQSVQIPNGPFPFPGSEKQLPPDNGVSEEFRMLHGNGKQATNP